MAIEIVKVQRPISPPNAPWLIYDKDRKHVEHRPDAVVNNYLREKMGDDFKAYFKGAWSSVVGWGISDRVPEQSW